MNLEKIIFGHITIEISIAFILGVACLFLYSWKQVAQIKTGYSVKRYLKPNPANIIFHLVSSFAMLLALHELGDIIIQKLGYNTNQTYHYTLAFLTGAFGGFFVAWVFEKARKLQNKYDNNIDHKHGEDCNH